MRTASSTSSYPITDATGPKISSCAAGFELSGTSSSVGSKKCPLVSWAGRRPPVTTFAPCATAAAT